MFSKLKRNKDTKLSRKHRNKIPNSPTSTSTVKVSKEPRTSASRGKKRGGSFVGNILNFDGKSKTSRNLRKPDLSLISFESISSDGNLKLEDRKDDEEIRTGFHSCARATDINAPSRFMKAANRKAGKSKISLHSHHTSASNDKRDEEPQQNEQSNTEAKGATRTLSEDSIYGLDDEDITKKVVKQKTISADDKEYENTKNDARKSLTMESDKVKKDI